MPVKYEFIDRMTKKTVTLDEFDQYCRALTKDDRAADDEFCNFAESTVNWCMAALLRHGGFTVDQHHIMQVRYWLRKAYTDPRYGEPKPIEAERIGILMQHLLGEKFCMHAWR